MPERAVAVFDLDGTLTRRDTLLPWLAYVRGRRAMGAAFLLTAPRIAPALLGLASRDDAKERLLARLLRGRALDELVASVEGFADHVVETGLRPEVMELARRHRASGHRTVVVSASPELYVGPLARRLGFEEGLGTRLEVDAEGRLTGRLVGRNCRGPEKVERLREWLQEDDAVVYAYGDSSGDRELLAHAGVNGRLLRNPRRHARRVQRDRMTSQPGQ